MAYKKTLELEHNIAALAVAILREDVSIQEQAFAVISGEKFNFTISDIKDMIKFKEQGFTYKQIGEIYGIDKYNVYSKIRRHRKKEGTVSK